MQKADLNRKLEPIYRILYCGHCKEVWQMRGKLTVKGKVVSREFTCPSCLNLAKVDFMTEPTNAAIQPRKDKRPMFYDSGLIQLNKKLLEEQPHG